MTNKISKTLLSVIVLSMVVWSVPKEKALAQLTVPIGTAFDFNITMQHVKDYVTDKLAYDAAGLLLQQVTDSVVNWINTGFEGNPSFLTDPQSFFLDTADQLTGAFIGNTGALSRLCSPFSVDVRLSLALDTANTPSRRYICTLGSIIDNVRNSTISGGGDVSVNGYTAGSVGGSATIEGFTGGDFRQGGWPAFIAMTTQPQNNIQGAYLQAKSDLEYQIATRQNDIQLDINLGSGFLSKQECEDVITFYAEDIKSGSIYEIMAGYENTGLNKKISADGSVTYQSCKTLTPGSVISSAINKSLGIPQDRLNMADSINKIANALFSQLITRVLQGGLLSAGGGRGGNTSAGIIAELEAQRNAAETGQVALARDQLFSAINRFESSSGLSTLLSYRKNAVSDIESVKDKYQSALSCFASIANSTNNTSSSFINSQISVINQALSSRIAPLESTHRQNLITAQAAVREISDIRNAISLANTMTEINTYSQKFNLLSTSADYQSSIAKAQSDYSSLSSTLDSLSSDAQRYLQSCSSSANSIRNR